MAFDERGFTVIAAAGSATAGSSHAVALYFTNDTAATVEADGYFDSVGPKLGDFALIISVYDMDGTDGVKIYSADVNAAQTDVALTAGVGYSGLGSAQQTIAAGDTTPSLAGFRNFATANTSATTITDFDDTVAGQSYLVQLDANTTIDFTGTNLKGNNGADLTGTVDTFLLVSPVSATGKKACFICDGTA
jgi:hypothetical protein